MSLISTQAELVAAFVARGWRVTLDEASQPFAELRMGDRVIASLLTKRSPSFPFNLAGWVTNDALSIAYTSIMHPRKRRAQSTPIVLSGRIDIEKQAASEEDIDRGCVELLDWARRVDLDAGVAALRDKEANSVGNMPARHLAALAATGTVEVLESYGRAFAKGDRIGFVPYITVEHIAAALDFARQRRAQPGWLPRSPRLRV